MISQEKNNENLIISRLIKIRREKGYTQKDVADYLGIKQPTFQGMENRRSFTLDVMIKVSEFLEVNFMELLNEVLNKDSDEDSTLLTYTPKDLEELSQNTDAKFQSLMSEIKALNKENKEIKEMLRELLEQKKKE